MNLETNSKNKFKKQVELNNLNKTRTGSVLAVLKKITNHCNEIFKHARFSFKNCKSDLPEIFSFVVKTYFYAALFKQQSRIFS